MATDLIAAAKERLTGLPTPQERARFVHDLVRALHDANGWRARPGDDTPERRSLGRVCDEAHEHWVRMSLAARRGEDITAPGPLSGT